MDVDPDSNAVPSPPPDDGRLNARRIRATVLERQAVLRRRRFRLVIGLALIAAGAQLWLMAVHAAIDQPGRAAVAWGAGLACFGLATAIIWKLPKSRAVDPAPMVPPDFTSLGQGNGFAERLEQMADNCEVYHAEQETEGRDQQ